MMQYKLNFAFSLTILFFIIVASWKSYGYAEIHYTFFGYSLINRNYPEIIVDAPWRIEPNEPIPVVCIIKDADRYPINLERLTARCRVGDKELFNKEMLSKSLPINEHYWHRVEYINLPSPQNDKLELSVEIEFTRNGRRKIITTDNLPGLSHKPLNIFMSSSKLPSFDGWYYGDAHYHSDMTQDQVEFGAPSAVAMSMGKALGLSWLAVVDHSYDLDVAIGEFFKYDPKLTRWQIVQRDAKLINSGNNGFVVIPAEEISCGNRNNHNIHLLAFNVPEFIPGKGDGVKRGLNRRPDLTLVECISRIRKMGGFAYAAHPEEGNGFMGRLLLKRGHWHYKDYLTNGYSGLQFWNGKQDEKLYKSREVWIKLLLEGNKPYILGGNDAHGDFNRCRGIKYPNTKLKELDNHVFGKIRTYAHCGDYLSLSGILNAIKNGNTIITNGPIVIPAIQNDNGRIANVGESISGRGSKLIINAQSSEEFGFIDKIDIYRGDIVNKVESLEITLKPNSDYKKQMFVHKIECPKNSYIRLEAKSLVRNEEYICFTNPIWLLT
ncbi:MAG: CehA/McbA family metallohydrolase [bacterium]